MDEYQNIILTSPRFIIERLKKIPRVIMSYPRVERRFFYEQLQKSRRVDRSVLYLHLAQR